MIIRKVNALAGAGKTFAAVHYADRNARIGHKYALVQPTQDLIDETVKEIRKLKPTYSVTAIHGDTSDTVIRDIVDDLITRAIKTEEYDPQYARVIANHADYDYLCDIARNRYDDDIYKLLQEFATCLTSPHWETFVLDAQYEKLIGGDPSKRGKLLAFAVLNPSILEGFKSATVMGACFEESMLFHLWSAAGVQFETHRAIEGQVRYTTHPNDHALTILYATDENWSKNMRKRSVEVNGKTVKVFDAIVNAIKAEFGKDEPFVWMGNRDLSDNLFGHHGRRLPNLPHGLNTFQNVHNCVVVSALNPSPAHFRFLETRGVDGDAVRDAYYHQAVYQAHMRTSQRDPKSDAARKLIVMDKGTAEWARAIFPRAAVGLLGSGVAPLKGKPGRPRKYADRAAADRAYRERQKARKMLEMDSLNAADQPAVSVSVFESKYARTVEALLDYADTDRFIDDLRTAWERPIQSKEANVLLSPAVFDADRSDETARGLANVEQVRGVWLDNDGGDLPHQEFAALFPRLRMVAMNTYSTAPGNERYRVFIPTRAAMPVAVHAEIMKIIEQTLNHAGYFSAKQIERAKGRDGMKRHGFDLSKFVSSSLFFVPSQAEVLEASFFAEFRDGLRTELDPYRWIERSTLAGHDPDAGPLAMPVGSEIIIEVTTDLDEELGRLRREQRVERAMNIYLSTPRGQGLGHSALMALGRRLSNAGLNFGEVRYQMEEAIRARPRENAKAEIAAVIKTLIRTPSLRAS